MSDLKEYRVAIRATITKTVTVSAKNEDEAIEEAHEIFDVRCTGMNEDYNQEDLYCEEINVHLR